MKCAPRVSAIVFVCFLCSPSTITYASNQPTNSCDDIQPELVHDTLAIELAGGLLFRYYNAKQGIILEAYYCAGDKKAFAEMSAKLLDIFKEIPGFQLISPDDSEMIFENTKKTHRLTFLGTGEELRMFFNSRPIDPDMKSIADQIKN